MVTEKILVIDSNNIVIDLIIVEPQTNDEETLNFATNLINDNTKKVKLLKYYEPHACINATYDTDNDKFIPVWAHPSWTFNKNTWAWEPPVAYPSGYNASIPTHIWNEEEQAWFKWDSVNLTFIE